MASGDAMSRPGMGVTRTTTCMTLFSQFWTIIGSPVKYEGDLKYQICTFTKLENTSSGKMNEQNIGDSQPWYWPGSPNKFHTHHEKG